MTTELATDLATKFVQFIETGEIPVGLFTPGVFCDFTSPRWRIQADGQEQTLALRLDGHPGPGTVPRWRCDATPTGFVIEWEEAWQSDGEDWYCREMARADVEDGLINAISVYCTGDWDTDCRAEHRQAVKLLRP